MTVLLTSSDITKALVGSGFLLLFLISLSAIVYSGYLRKFYHMAAEVFFWMISFLFCQLTEMTRPCYINRFNHLSLPMWIVQRPLIFFVLLQITLAAGILWVYLKLVHYSRTHVTTEAIKMLSDEMHCGICFWRKNGKVIFSNSCMKELCFAITGRGLMNGNEFKACLYGEIIKIDGIFWNFEIRELEYDREPLFEMKATDISKEYLIVRELEQGTRELTKMKAELAAYQINIDDIVRRQEVLQAKMHIHDEMNRLMLTTTAADTADIKKMDRIFDLWEQNALLLSHASEDISAVNAVERLHQLADALNVRLDTRGQIPKNISKKQRELLFAAAYEAIINCVKHGEADRMEIVFEQNDTTVICRFSNSGKMPEKEVTFTGGLANLKLMAEEQGAELSVQIGEKFTLQMKINL
ncbi:MAG: hypothetical protein Q4B85_08410 [Lachnospiraceae bacterium]|nr:hypothetical protein [Lachnospiraceae bacterium]